MFSPKIAFRKTAVWASRNICTMLFISLASPWRELFNGSFHFKIGSQVFWVTASWTRYEIVKKSRCHKVLRAIGSPYLCLKNAKSSWAPKFIFYKVQNYLIFKPDIWWCVLNININNLSWWWLSQNIDNLNHIDGKICKWTSEKMIINITLSFCCSIGRGDDSIFAVCLHGSRGLYSISSVIASWTDVTQLHSTSVLTAPLVTKLTCLETYFSTIAQSELVLVIRKPHI